MYPARITFRLEDSLLSMPQIHPVKCEHRKNRVKTDDSKNACGFRAAISNAANDHNWSSLEFVQAVDIGFNAT